MIGIIQACIYIISVIPIIILLTQVCMYILSIQCYNIFKYFNKYDKKFNNDMTLAFKQKYFESHTYD